MVNQLAINGGVFRNINIVGVSVVIVCYNSKDRIKPTLDHLAAQEGIDFPWEVILVDNNSNDNTGVIAQECWKEIGLNVPFTVVLEKRPGTMYARYTGIVSANFRYLLFVDDDNWLAENYVRTAYETIRHDNTIAAVGGRGIMEFEKGFTPPDWVARYEKSYGCGPQGKKDGDTTNDQGWLYTAGAILDRVWLDRLYSAGFESALKGRDGKSLAPGEDSELTYALKIIGGKLYYCSEMTFKHFMPKNRMTWKYLKKQHFAFGTTTFVLWPYQALWSKHGKNYWMIRLLILSKTFLKNLVLVIRNKLSLGNPYTLRLFRILGEVKSIICKRYTFNKAKKVVRALLTNNESGTT
jgi:glycosyltransferase involved in cell wall biosynthesis